MELGDCRAACGLSHPWRRSLPAPWRCSPRSTPYVKITVIDGKRSPDWLPLRYVAHRYVRGTHPDKHGDPVLLTGEDGRQPSPWTIKRAMRRVRTKAKNLPAGFWGCMPAGAVDAAD